MTHLDYQLDARDLRRLRLLESVSRTTAAKVLTFTAEKAIPAWRAGNEAVFTLRRRAFIQKGVRVRMATASDLNAKIGTIDRFMSRHVVGIGEPKVAASGRMLFVPNQPIADQGTHTQTRRTLAAMLRTNRKPFILHVADGRVVLVRREGKGRSPLRVLGSLRKTVKIRPRLDVLGIVAPVVERSFGPVFERLLVKWSEGAPVEVRSRSL
jgi:hypothetical protein